MYPITGLVILSFFGHVAGIHQNKMACNLAGLWPNEQAAAILTVGVVLIVVMFYGLTDGLRGITIPAEYGVLVGR